MNAYLSKMILNVWLVIALLAPSALAQFSITGTVTGNLAAPVPNVEIRLFDGASNPIGIPLTLTNASGFYSIAGLPSGDYIVEFNPPIIARLVAANQDVTINGASVVLNKALQPGHLLSGFVRDSGGIGIPNIDLQVTDRDTGDPVITPGDDTDATGFYDVIVPTGEFDLRWRAVAAGSLPWIPVEMREFIDQDTTIDVTMVIGMFVSGTVRNTFGNPVANVNMDFIDIATGIKLDTPGDNTNLAGFYQVQVPIGTYDVVAKPRVIDRLVAGQLTDVPISMDTTSLDFVLQPGVSLSGRVTRLAGSGVAGVDIDVEDALTGLNIVTPFDVTDALGFYEIIVPTGQLAIAFQPAPATLLAPVLISPTMINGDTVLNVVLQNGLVLSGTVRNNLGDGVPGTDIDAKDVTTGLGVPLVGDGTDAAGNYSVVIAPGTYDLEFEPPRILGLVAVRMPAVTLAGNTTLNVTLNPGARITGTVTDADGLAMSNVDVDAFLQPSGAVVFTPGDHSNVQGMYEVIIPLGTYRFLFKPDPASARPDSVELLNEVVSGNRVIDIQFPDLVLVGVEDGPVPGAGRFTLSQNAPNPFNPSTVIQFSLDEPAPVRLQIYSVAGNLVKVLRDDHLAAGEHAVAWNGTDRLERQAASGVYFYRLTVGEVSATRKMMLLE